MTKGVKIALGCGAAGCVGVVLVGIVIVGGLGAGAFWAKGKVESVVAEQEQIQKQIERANEQNPFTRPDDGVVQEARLLKFLEIRKRVFTVYDQHRAAIEKMEKDKEGDFASAASLLGIFNDARLAQAKALADVGMSQDEYQFLVESIYKSAWATALTSREGQRASDAASEAMAEAQKQLQKGAEEAERRGVSGAQIALDEAMKQAREAQSSLDQLSQSLETPAANVELFKKHQDEIRKYAMAGFELVGL